MKTLGLMLISLLLTIGGIAPADPGAEQPAWRPGSAGSTPTSGLQDPVSQPATAQLPSTKPAVPEDGAVRFGALHVELDAGDVPLAAYQIEITAVRGDVKLAGLEGGDHPAFKPAPHYDPAALLDNKVIVAGFSTAADLPKGKTRVATLMVQITGREKAAYEGRLILAAGPDGKTIPAKLILTPTADGSEGVQP